MENTDLMIMFVLILVIIYFYKITSCPEYYYLNNNYCTPCIGGTISSDKKKCQCPSGTSLNNEGSACLPNF